VSSSDDMVDITDTNPSGSDGSNDAIDRSITAARRGAKVVLFTDPYLSPLASSATVLLTTVVDGPRPFLTLAPALAVVESIVLGVVEASGTRLRRRLESFDRLTARDPR